MKKYVTDDTVMYILNNLEYTDVIEIEGSQYYGLYEAVTEKLFVPIASVIEIYDIEKRITAKSGQRIFIAKID